MPAMGLSNADGVGEPGGFVVEGGDLQFSNARKWGNFFSAI